MMTLVHVRRRLARARRSSGRPGFSLIEVLISMSILAVVLSSLAGLSFLVAKRGRNNELTTKRNFVLQQQANRLGAMSAANLALEGSSTETMSIEGFSFTRQITITTIGTNRWQIKVKITPTDDPTRPDSVIFDRSRPATGTPLCTVC